MSGLVPPSFAGMKIKVSNRTYFCCTHYPTLSHVIGSLTASPHLYSCAIGESRNLSNVLQHSSLETSQQFGRTTTQPLMDEILPTSHPERFRDFLVED